MITLDDVLVLAACRLYVRHNGKATCDCKGCSEIRERFECFNNHSPSETAVGVLRW